MDELTMQRIKKIHDEYTIVDAHFDLLSNVEIERRFGYRKVIETNYLSDIKKGGVDVLVCSIFITNIYVPEMALKKALDQISALLAEIQESGDKLALCKNYQDTIAAKASGKLSILLSLEGAEPISNDINLLSIFYELGVRFLGLTWSRRNFVADGNPFGKPAPESRLYGLSEFGAELVKKAESLGMIIDVSHLSDAGFWDVMKIAQRPVIASHSNCRALINSMRNLTDEQLRLLAEKGGVIGMNNYNIYVSETDNFDIYANDLVKHVNHIKNLVGIEHIGLGMDFCDFLIEAYNLTPAIKPERIPHDTLRGHKELWKITEALISLGYSDDEIGLVLGGNFMNFYKKLL